MYTNTKSYYVCAAILSKLLSFEKKKDIENTISLIEDKFSKIPNTDYLSIWLQRITITYKPKRNLLTRRNWNANSNCAKAVWQCIKRAKHGKEECPNLIKMFLNV